MARTTQPAPARGRGQTERPGGKPPGRESTAVEKRKTTALAQPLDFSRDAGAGFEEADADSFAIPYLTVLQKNSPQCDDASGSYVKGAKPGMFFNTVTGELYDGPVRVVPVHYERRFVQWAPRDEGGGFRGSHMASDQIVQRAERDDSTGRLMLENGDYLSDTRYHFCLLVKKDGSTTPVILSLASTQIRKSRNWMTTMQGIKLRRPDGSPFTPPSFSHFYAVTTVPEQNEKGSWKGLRVDLEGPLGDDDRDVYLDARQFREQVRGGKARVSDPGVPDAAESASSDDGDDDPEM